MRRASDRSGAAPVGVRVGDIGSGPSAVIDAGGGVTPLPPATGWSSPHDWSVQWWIGSEERWHVPVSEAACRQQRLDAMPVIETALKVPGGDARARTYGAVLAGSDHGVVVVEVENATAVPFAVGFVLLADAPITTDGTNVAVDGVVVLRLTRAAARFAHAATPEALRAELEAERFVECPTSPVRGALALVMPVAHTASVVAVCDPRATSSRRSDANVGVVGPVERGSIPGADQVVAGWRRFCSSPLRLELGDDARLAAFDAACAELLMGPPPVVDAAELAAIATALARLGRLDEIDGFVESVVDAQKLDGRIDAHDPLDATVRSLAMVAALWGAGAGVERVAPLIGPIAKAAHWLGRSRRRHPIEPGTSDARRAARVLRGVAPALRAVEQPEVADDVESFAERLSVEPAHRSGATIDTAPVTDTVTSGAVPAAVAAADLVVARLDGLVRETADGLDVFGAWVPSDRGVGLEAHGVPTRWGVVSVAMRWHGERPALLWELEPYEGRVDGGAPVWRAPAIDPSWSSSQARGEALLAAP